MTEQDPTPATAGDDTEGHGRRFTSDDARGDDTEGRVARRRSEGDTEGHVARLEDEDDDDTEGHKRV